MELREAASGQLIRIFEGHAVSDAPMALSPDRKWAALGSFDGRLKLLDTASGQLIYLVGHPGVGPVSGAFSPDGTRLLSGGRDGVVKLWDATDGLLIRTFEGASPVRSVAFSPDGTRVLSGSEDGRVLVWNTRTGRLLATLFGSGTRWLAFAPAGFFASSGSANGLIGIVRGLDVTSIDQMHQSLFNPDLVREAIAGDPQSEVAEAARVVDLEKVVESGPPPSVAIASPADGSESASDLVTVTARIEDRGKGVGRVEWRVNGITAAVAAKPSDKGPVHTVTRQLALEPGDNAIEVVAYNGSNLLASLPASTTVNFTGPADKVKPKLHILAIGINAYADKGWINRGRIQRGFPPLTLAVKDATNLASEIKRAAGPLYADVIVTPVLDDKATRDNIDRVVSEIAKNINPRATFILFAAAHGKSENGRFYLIPQDYQSGPGALQERAIGQD